MALKSINQLRWVRVLAIRLRVAWLRHIGGVDAAPSIQASLASRFAPAAPGSIIIGEQSLIAFKALILSGDPRTGEVRPVRIGARCFIGGGSLILPGVTIGDDCIIGAGAVVFEDVPPRSAVGGNPARVLRTGIEVGPFGRMIGAEANSNGGWTADP
jgi:maltose O-acetyltransferase